MRGGSILEPRTRGCTPYLNKDLAQGDERRADLRHEQAADEEVALVLPEELWNQRKHTLRNPPGEPGSNPAAPPPPPTHPLAAPQVKGQLRQREKRGRLQRQQPPDALDVLLSFNFNSTAVK